MTKSLYRLAASIVIAACMYTSTLAEPLSNGKGDLRVMTYNANEGSDFIEVQQATNGLQFLVAVGQTITQVRATNPPARMQALAKQIIAAGPALVAVQEVDQWATGPLDPSTFRCGQTTLEYDMLQELQDALAEQGGHYTVVKQAQQYAFPPTPGLILPQTFLCVQVVNYVAILARTDLDQSKFTWSNPQSAQYAASLFFPTPAGTVPFPRAWASVDASFHGQAFRFITTHLESVDTTPLIGFSIRELQGAELRDGPANTALPIVLAMDSNSPAAPLPQDPTYLAFTLAGYHDGWSEIFPGAPGFTCCQAELDNNLVSQLNQRIDLILTHGSVEVQNVALYGANQSSKTTGGLWPSDHAGVAAQLAIETQ
jgi:endonuclease/exonuclease/phosphatase family metal-dependent hydrolase